MKKLFLTLDDLQVDSFATMDEGIAVEKTVHAYVSIQSCSCMECATLSGCDACGGGTRVDPTCVGNPTCDPTCGGYTCDYDTCAIQCTRDWC
jgi:hypothetical protein